jgi:hypothetical protein
LTTRDATLNEIDSSTRITVLLFRIQHSAARDLRELAAVGDLDLLGGAAGAGPDLLDGLDDVHALDDLAEDDVLAVEPGGGDGADEELGAVGVGPGVGHGEDAGAGVLADELLVGELLAVDGLAAGAVAAGEVAALAHEVGDHAVERRPLVVERLAAPARALLAGAERAEVLRRAGHLVGVQLHHDLPGRGAADGHVEENAGAGVGHLCFFGWEVFPWLRRGWDLI